MDINSAFGSYLKAVDLPDGKIVRLRIRSVVMEDIGDSQHKAVMYFERAQKGCVLNKTNATMLALGFGPETDGWTGREVDVYSEVTMFKGSPTRGIRIKPVAPAPVAAPAPAQPMGPTATPSQYQTNNQLDDAVPF
jgi:hypothetical protein